MKPVLFASIKPLELAENLKAIWDAFDGEKEFVKTDGMRRSPEIRSGRYDLMVIDEYPSETPGKCIMICHGIAGGKTYGLDQPNPYFRKGMEGMITWLVTSGTGAVPLLAKCSNLPESKVLGLGFPRTDGFLTARKGDGGTVLAKKRAYLYVPTFRTREDPPYPRIDWGAIDSMLTDDELLVVKTHRVQGNLLLQVCKHIIQVSSREPSTPYLIDCDAVITDYSSILFDGYVLGKPGVLFEKNQGYTESRGMYLKYPEEYCSRYARTEEQLVKLLREADGLGKTERSLISRMADGCDGHAAERVCELIRKTQMEDIP